MNSYAASKTRGFKNRNVVLIIATSGALLHFEVQEFFVKETQQDNTTKRKNK